MNFKITEKVIKNVTITVVIYLLCFGIAMAFFPIRPFWNDEWRLIYNLKFKTITQLWGPLDLLQQCPRTYLTILKEVTSYFDYSYTALRLPALVITAASALFIFYLKKKIFPGGNSIYSYLFILILISSQTFTDYIVQVKHYEMDIFLCLLALWQLMTLSEICNIGSVGRSRYLLLCLSFLAAPFFSYVYPIAIAPIFPVMILNSVASVKNKQNNKGQFLLSLYLPLVITAISVFVFYRIDVRQLMADDRMYQSYIKLCYNGTKESFPEEFWKLFSLVGSGALFEIIFGILGVVSFSYGIYVASVTLKKQEYSRENNFRLYAVALLLVVLCLFLAEKLLGGVARLTAFTVPSISILIVLFFEAMKKQGYTKPANIAAAVLFLGLLGNIVSTCIGRFTYPEYANRIKTYWHTEEALKLARLNKIPILITDGVRGVEDGIREDQGNVLLPAPGTISFNTITPAQVAGSDTLCAEAILKDDPEYKVWAPVPVYVIPDMKWINEYMKQLPPEYRSAIACDGISYKTITR